MKMHLPIFKCAIRLLAILIIASSLQICHSYQIDKLEYSKMPKLFTLDPYEECFQKPDAIYCVVDIHLHSKTSSDLWDQIKNISSDPSKRYRHDILHKGMCVTDRCKVPDIAMLIAMNVTNLLEIGETTISECVNEELEKKYQLEGNTTIRYCETGVYSRELNTADWVYIAVILVILMMSGMGTIYDVWCQKRGIKAENRLLLSFSIPKNWQRNLTFESLSKRKKCFKPIDGLRFFFVNSIVYGHSPIAYSTTYVDNTFVMDSIYQIRGSQFTSNLSLFIQFFFCMSSFLMSYNFLNSVERTPIKNIFTYFKFVLNRWMRLTPVYAVVLGFLCTLYDYMGTGPLWRDNIVVEAATCRYLWWTHLVYINNYVDLPLACYDVSWYLAAEMQLFCYGVLVMMIVWKFPSISRYVFGLLVTFGIIIPGLQTYFYNYYPIIPPDTDRTMNHFKHNPTFGNIYITLSGNVFGYTIGLIAGSLQYYFEKNDISLKKIKWFRVLFYFSWPMIFCMILSGGLFLNDDYVYDPIISGVYVSLHRPIFAFFAMTFVIGAIHKCYDISRGFLEWDGFQLLSKFSYCVYIVHHMIQRYSSGFLFQPYHMVPHNTYILILGNFFLIYGISFVLYLFVEIPFQNLQELIFRKKRESPTIKEDKNKTETVMSIDVE